MIWWLAAFMCAEECEDMDDEESEEEIEAEDDDFAAEI